jgi:hypothetical protein
VVHFVRHCIQDRFWHRFWDLCQKVVHYLWWAHSWETRYESDNTHQRIAHSPGSTHA